MVAIVLSGREDGYQLPKLSIELMRDCVLKKITVKDSERMTTAIESAENRQAAHTAQDLAAALEESNDVERQLEAISQDLVKTQDLSGKQTMCSPVRGIVKGLAVNSIGGIVTPAQVLMEIVPLDESLEVEAFLGNKDIGFVWAGQSAKIKAATYPFTKYGTIAAKVADVAEDATVNENLGIVCRTARNWRNPRSWSTGARCRPSRAWRRPPRYPPAGAG